MKLRLIAALLLVLALLLCGCGAKTKTVHCDRCGKEVELPADSKIDEDWIFFCPDCAEEIGPIVQP